MSLWLRLHLLEGMGRQMGRTIWRVGKCWCRRTEDGGIARALMVICCLSVVFFHFVG
jgi:hypothetical protein